MSRISDIVETGKSAVGINLRLKIEKSFYKIYLCIDITTDK